MTPNSQSIYVFSVLCCGTATAILSKKPVESSNFSIPSVKLDQFTHDSKAFIQIIHSIADKQTQNECFTAFTRLCEKPNAINTYDNDSLSISTANKLPIKLSIIFFFACNCHAPVNEDTISKRKRIFCDA